MPQGFLGKQLFHFLVDAEASEWRLNNAVENEGGVDKHGEPDNLKRFERLPA